MLVTICHKVMATEILLRTDRECTAMSHGQRDSETHVHVVTTGWGKGSAGNTSLREISGSITVDD